MSNDGKRERKPTKRGAPSAVSPQGLPLGMPISHFYTPPPHHKHPSREREGPHPQNGVLREGTVSVAPFERRRRGSRCAGGMGSFLLPRGRRHNMTPPCSGSMSGFSVRTEGFSWFLIFFLFWGTRSIPPAGEFGSFSLAQAPATTQHIQQVTDKQDGEQASDDREQAGDGSPATLSPARPPLLNFCSSTAPPLAPRAVFSRARSASSLSLLQLNDSH